MQRDAKSQGWWMPSRNLKFSETGKMTHTFELTKTDSRHEAEQTLTRYLAIPFHFGGKSEAPSPPPCQEGINKR